MLLTPGLRVFAALLCPPERIEGPHSHTISLPSLKGANGIYILCRAARRSGASASDHTLATARQHPLRLLMDPFSEITHSKPRSGLNALITISQVALKRCESCHGNVRGVRRTISAHLQLEWVLLVCLCRNEWKCFPLPPHVWLLQTLSHVRFLCTDDPTDMRAFELALVAISADLCYTSALQRGSPWSSGLSGFFTPAILLCFCCKWAAWKTACLSCFYHQRY